jgi:hypothetical protein
MKQVVIENPVINTPFKEPNRHFRFTEEGISGEMVESRRVSSYFIPIARPKKKGKQTQLSFDTEWTQDRVKENEQINKIRSRISLWRQGGYLGITRTTARLLEHWSDPEREKKLFFCQIEALETLIYLNEAAKKFGDAWIENEIRLVNDHANPIVGETSIHTLEGLKDHREQEVAFFLAKKVLEKYFRDDDGNLKPWLFPQLLQISRRWLEECLILKDNTFLQLLLLIEFTHSAADRIYQSIVSSEEGEKAIKPILRPYDTIGSTRYVKFDTTRPVYATNPAKCHIFHVVADTGSWEQKMASALEEMEEVRCYAKNYNVGFTVPYTINGEEKSYYPDFIVQINSSPPLNLIIEVTGEQKKDKAAKTAIARALWVPAVNNHGGFGRWSFLEITDPWDAKNIIRRFLENQKETINDQR